MSFYCDGSKDEKSGFSGAGVVSVDKDLMPDLAMPLGKYTSSYFCEILAIHNCVTYLLHTKISRQDIIIYSDCQAALLSLKAYSFNSRIVFETFCYLQKLSSRNRLTLIWVPGHSGFVYNEQADSTARAAVLSNYETYLVEPILPITITYCKTALRDVLRELQIDDWRKRVDVRQSRLMMSKPQRNLTKTLLCFSRRKLRLLTFVLSGHAPVNRHLFLMKQVPDAHCQYCKLELETMIHIIVTCPRWSRVRAEIFGSEYLDLSEILDLPWPILLKFIEMTGRFIQ